MTSNAADAIIRPVRADDAVEVWELVAQFATSYQPVREAYAVQFSALLTAEYARFFVAERDSCVVGYILAFHLPALYANGIVCEIHELMVSPQHRSAGIGKALVQAIIAAATQAGGKEVTVPTRRAGDYYRSLGFTASANYFKLILPATDDRVLKIPG